ncbi:MAG: putative inorganic carbon transporter subunit DabA [Oligoflexales bacterium]
MLRDNNDNYVISHEGIQDYTYDEKKIDVDDIVQSVMKYVMPSWPLQNAVAVNPFWNLRDRDFSTVMKEVKKFNHTSAFYNLKTYCKFFEEGDIHLIPLKKAFAQQKYNFSFDFDNFITESNKLSLGPCDEFNVKNYTEFYLGNNWNELIVAEAGNHAARYLDERQSLVGEEKNQSFWIYWLDTLNYDDSMKHYGFKNFSRCFDGLRNKDLNQALVFMLKNLGLKDEKDIAFYLQRNLSFVLGWSSVFAKDQWEKSVGYSADGVSYPVDMLCVMVAYDYGIFIESKKARKRDFLTQVNRDKNQDDCEPENFKSVWHLAWEWTRQEKFNKKLSFHAEKITQKKYQMVFCIDVRSEILRKSIEENIENTQTIGFAGFFGLPVEYKIQHHSDEQKRLPVLLKSAYRLENREDNSMCKVVKSSIMKFLKNMRKQSFSSFSYVEFFGFFSFFSLLYESFFPFWKKNLSSDVCQTINPENIRISKENNDIVSVDELAFSCANILRHMGITQYAERIVIVGHGSQTRNNAFGSSLHCGACGGHSGDVNSQVLCYLMNRTDVREKLKNVYGVEIPQNTKFIPALHETVTDEVHFLFDDTDKKLEFFQKKLREVAKLSQKKRKKIFGFRDDTAQRRSTNWAEVRPEWGLTGNHSFVVAPRSRTQNVSLEGRSFLHDYTWRNDKDFNTLELIMTAPMVVTNWINLQYYYSSMMPGVYGAGNKILHNLVNESGVYEGNGGDLKIGLPMQSVHNGQKMLHEPLRLSVYIEAPLDAIEGIIQKHTHVRNLIENGWLHLLRIDDDGVTYRRLNSGQYDALV